VALTGLAYGYAVTGKRAEAQKVLDKLNELSKQKYVSAVFMAKIYSGLRDKDRAFQWLEKAYEDRSIVCRIYKKRTLCSMLCARTGATRIFCAA
jgi:Tfp pilus assembly protein PilF